MRQSGNVLFLILIAVALFAALSYAVTKSTSGGGDASSEQERLQVSEILQSVSGLKFAIQRMQVRGVALDRIRFSYDRFVDKTGTVGDAAAQASWDSIHNAYGTDPEAEIFHPDGGGATFAHPSTGLCSDEFCQLGAGFGYFYPFHAGQGISIEGVGGSGAEIFMFYGPIRPSVCNDFNDYLDLGTGSYPTDSDGDTIIEFFSGARMACGNFNGVAVIYFVLAEQ